MTSWISRLRRRSDVLVAEPAEASPPVSRMVAIEIYTESRAALPVGVDGGGERITDLLNGTDSLSIDNGADMENLDVNEILAVVPPPERWTDGQRRLHRIRRPIRMQVGPYEIDGHAHIPPGALPSGYLFRVKPHFVPLTEAVIRRVDDRSAERRLPVLITNYRRLEQITELRTQD